MSSIKEGNLGSPRAALALLFPSKVLFIKSCFGAGSESSYISERKLSWNSGYRGVTGAELALGCEKAMPCPRLWAFLVE